MDTTTTLAVLRKESQSVFNRIHAIAEDAGFVNQVHDHYRDLPLLPNMRCGAWYTDPKIASPERAYFKSTDGHTNNWSFNLRRPNLHILPLIVKHAGLVLVDSTRAGKRIPDALSKTVPIWCSVVNRAIHLRRATLPDSPPGNWDTALYTPPGSVSPQEHSQIALKLDGWASQLAASSYKLPDLDRPLRPIWITPATSVFPTFPSPPDRVFYPILCVSASKLVTDGIERRVSGFTYIQGSGDDHELWSMGLTPTLFWRHYDEILTAGPVDILELVRTLVAESAHADGDDTHPNLRPFCYGTPIEHIYGRITICSLASLVRCPHPPQENIAILYLTPPIASTPAGSEATPPSTTTTTDPHPTTLHIPTPDGKKGQHHFLTTVLPLSMPFIQYHLTHDQIVCIACTTGTNLAVGVALAALALFFHPDGSLSPQGNVREDISKDMLKTRLQWIISNYSQANPSRTTLKRVNDFLLSPFSLSPLFTSG